MSSSGRWDYSKPTQPEWYGDDTTYVLGARFLAGLSVEDWGCGLGWFRRFHQGPCFGIDGSPSRHANLVQDLSSRRSRTPGLFMRHVLEHNLNWRVILDNALHSFEQRMVLILFTPLEGKDHVLTPLYAPIPDISLARGDLETLLEAAIGLTGGGIRTQRVASETRYGGETIFYLRRSGSET